MMKKSNRRLAVRSGAPHDTLDRLHGYPALFYALQTATCETEYLVLELVTIGASGLSPKPSCSRGE